MLLTPLDAVMVNFSSVIQLHIVIWTALEFMANGKTFKGKGIMRALWIM